MDSKPPPQPAQKPAVANPGMTNLKWVSIRKDSDCLFHVVAVGRRRAVVDMMMAVVAAVIVLMSGRRLAGTVQSVAAGG